MKKNAWSRIKSVIQKSDIILEILDIRAPELTRSEKLENMIFCLDKKLIIVLNKADLVPKRQAEKTKEIYKQIAYCIYISTKTRYGKRRLLYAIRRSAERYSGRDDIYVAVVGYPNVGKSSLINMLCGRAKASTSPVPGHTKGEQWIRLSDKIVLYDTPGIIPREDNIVELVLKGAFGPDKIRDPVPVAWQLIDNLRRQNPEVIRYYGATPDNSTEKILEEMAARFGLLLKGGEYNIEEMAKKLIRDWQRGKIQKIINESEGG